MNEAIVIPESVTPEGLRARADIVRKALGDESCARHLELAADEIVKLSNVPLPATKVLVELLDKFAAADDDGLRRAAMLDAAITLRAFAQSYAGTKHTRDDSELGATAYLTATEKSTREVKFTLLREKRVLGHLVFSCEQVYDTATHLLHLYDQLEGIE
jgi:hypothetical protein